MLLKGEFIMLCRSVFMILDILWLKSS